MEVLALLGLGAAAVGTLETIWGKVEVFNSIWPVINYHSRIDENRQILKRKLESLCCVEDDINKTLEVEEFRSGKKRKREVDHWLTSVQRKKNDVQGMEKQIEGRKYSLGPWWESRLEKSIREVEELYERGKFDCPLVDAHKSSGNELLTTKLIGHNSNEGVLGRIWSCLMNDNVQRIGVYGVKGVGKTAIMMHIHNQLLQNGTFNHVYWVTVSEDFSIHKLQSDIAKEVGLNHFDDEEDTRKRAAKLHKGLLKRKKCVIILDGILKRFDLDEVGFPTQVNDCKLIVTAGTLMLCRMMDCQETVEIEPLSVGEADNLFREKIGLKNPLSPHVEEIAKQIIKECGGLPLKIIRIAESMRGVDDINEWRYTLNVLRECSGIINDHL